MPEDMSQPNPEVTPVDNSAEAQRLRDEAAQAEGSFTQRVKEAQANQIEAAGAVEAIGDNAVSESVQQIPVVDKTTAPSGASPGEQSLVHDLPTAYAMAEGADPARTLEANQRSAVQAIDTFGEKLEAIRQDPRATVVDPDRGPVSTEWAIEQKTKLEDDTRAKLEAADRDSYDTLNYLRMEANGKGDQESSYNLESEKQILQMAEKRAQLRAERLEEWGRILHEHPVSEKYEYQYVFRVTFSPEGMVNLEDEVSRSEADIQEMTSKVDKINGLRVLNGFEHRTGIGDLFNYFAGTQRKELQGRFGELAANPSTTLGQLTEFYQEVFREGLLKRLSSELEEKKKILEDVRSGKTGDASPPEA